MASLTGQKIKDTYQSLLKTNDNGLITTAFKNITDGVGDTSGLYLKDDGVLISGSLTLSGSLLYSGNTIDATVTSASYAVTASYAMNGGGNVILTAGPGIIINGSEITASVRSLNGIFPIDGNIASSLTQTITGTSASLVLSSSGDITGSFPDGLVWIITSGPGTGSLYIFASGSVGQWYPIASADQALNDARYLMLTPQTSLGGNLNMGGFNITNAGTYQGTASWASNAISSSYPIAVTGSTLQSVSPAGGVGGSTTDSVFLGYQAGYQAANANNSNFLGYQAGYLAISASNSIFMGYSAGIYAWKAYSSNFLGISAGDGAEFANNSNFLGYNAGLGSYSASYSNFIGAVAGANAYNANNSNFLGRQAGYLATSANNSSFLGYQAGYQATSANNSNFLGNSAGYGATSAYHSNFLGQNAGRAATNANNSNFLGYNAGSGSSGNNVNAFGNSAGSKNALSGMTIFSNSSLPSYANYTAASSSINVANGASANCTYLYHDQSTNSIGAVRLS